MPFRSTFNTDGNNNVYFNVEINNPLMSGTNSTQVVYAQHAETTTQSIIDYPEDYYLSIVRFSVPGGNIPLTVMQVINGQNNPNLTPYIVCLSYDGNDYPVNMLYIPTGNYPIPIAPNPVQDYQNPYYNIFSYDHVISMINTALMTSFQQMKTANPGVASDYPPFLTFDPITKLISLNVESSYVSPPFGGAGPTVEIYFNTVLVTTYLSGFEMFFNGGDAINSKNYRAVIRYRFNNGYPAYDADPTNNANASNTFYTPGTVANNITPGAPIVSPTNQYFYPPTNPPRFLSVTQNYQSLQTWSSFKSIVFKSASLPVNSEFVPQGIALGNQTKFGSGAVNFQPILTDFQLSIQSADEVRQQIEFYPQGPYRLVDMLNNNPLNKFDVQVYWTDIFDNLRPITIPLNGSASIKFLFVRKSVYSAGI